MLKNLSKWVYLHTQRSFNFKNDLSDIQAVFYFAYLENISIMTYISSASSNSLLQSVAREAVAQPSLETSEVLSAPSPGALSFEAPSAKPSYHFGQKVAFQGGNDSPLRGQLVAGVGNSFALPQFDCVLPDPERETNTARQSAGAALSVGYLNAPYSGELALGPLDSMDDRIAALNQLSQLDELTETSELSDENRCLPSAIVAGVILAEGQEGLITLLDSIEDYAARSDAPLELSALRERIVSGQANNSDMAQLQNVLYQTLNRLEHQCSGELIQNTSALFFLQSFPELQAMFEQHDLRIMAIDTGDEDDLPNHAVLKMGDALLYDSGPRSDGQVMTPQHSQWENYQMATAGQIYPLEIEFDDGLEIPIRDVQLSPEGWASFLATDGTHQAVGVIQSNGENTYYSLPTVGTALEDAEGRLIQVQEIDVQNLSEISELNGNIPLARFAGEAIWEENGQSYPVIGEYLGDGSWWWNWKEEE